MRRSETPQTEPADGPSDGATPAHAGVTSSIRRIVLDSTPEAQRQAAARKPLLASEALMDDLAPLQPARRDARRFCAILGAAYVVFGLLSLVRVIPGAASAGAPWLVGGAVVLVAGLARVTYRQRAVAMVVLGLLSCVIALDRANGALIVAGGGPIWTLARVMAVVALPAALLFRARYRAYKGARVVLGGALLLSLPLAAYAVGGFLGESSIATIGSVLVVIALIASLTGFMGSDTTGAGAYVSAVVIVALALDLALRCFVIRGLAPEAAFGAAAGTLGLGGGAGLASLGLFQILAIRFAADARRIDLHSPRSSDDPTGDRDTISDWSTRE